MSHNQRKLKAAIAANFIPKDLKETMSERNHQAQLQVVDEIDQGRVGVSYTNKNLDGTTTTYTSWYTPEEIDEMLKNNG